MHHLCAAEEMRKGDLQLPGAWHGHSKPVHAHATHAGMHGRACLPAASGLVWVLSTSHAIREDTVICSGGTPMNCMNSCGTKASCLVIVSREWGVSHHNSAAWHMHQRQATEMLTCLLTQLRMCTHSSLQYACRGCLTASPGLARLGAVAAD